MSGARAPSWTPWTLRDVVDVDYPAFALRTYLEQADVRAYLQRISASKRIGQACEIGCGYGRMTVVLTEFASRVVGFERQPEFVEEARRLHPGIEIASLTDLGALPCPDGAFDFVLAFTVLQHLTETAVARAVAEIRRVVRPSGSVLICEETDPGHSSGDVADEAGRCTIGRPVATYAALFTPFRLVATSPRRIEPTYPRPDVGTYMLFEAGPGSTARRRLGAGLRSWLRTAGE